MYLKLHGCSLTEVFFVCLSLYKCSLAEAFYVCLKLYLAEAFYIRVSRVVYV